jgi:uncharacterized membrane protein YidH (DUF202 family)
LPELRPLPQLKQATANERTYLSYFRTSMAFSMTGVVIAQFFRLAQSPTPSPVLSFYAIGTPLACVFQVAGLVIALLGGHRFWRQQMAMAKGKVWAGGWEIWTLMAMTFLVRVAGTWAAWLRKRDTNNYVLVDINNLHPDCSN